LNRFYHAEEMRRWVRGRQAEGARVGFVPTMGALHEGHMALVRQAGERADAVGVSIFVNPTQFGPNEDFEKYPRPLVADLARLESAGVEAVFTPEAAEIYPDGFRTSVHVEGISEVLEGAIRPDHFRGVATVVAKLLNIVPADIAVFGQKDYQQLVILRRMVEDLNLPTEIVAHPTVRERDGLALSSRNRYLSPEERSAAPALHRALEAVRQAAAGGARATADLEDAAWRVLDEQPAMVPDYAVALDPATLAPLQPDWRRAVCLVAVRLGGTRLLDNIIFDAQGTETSA
jgi:pantoate--beta-alanine ligase